MAEWRGCEKQQLLRVIYSTRYAVAQSGFFGWGGAATAVAVAGKGGAHNDLSTLRDYFVEGRAFSKP